MKNLILFILLFTAVSYSSNEEMKFIREQFYRAVGDEEALGRLENYINKKYSTQLNSYPPVILAYRGGVEALKAKYVFSPFSKFEYVNESLSILEKAVNKMPQNLEIRFIRFSILDNIPFFMGYGEERESDKKVVIAELLKNDFSAIDRETQKGLINYLLENSSLTDEEMAMLKNECLAYKEQ